MKNYNEIIRSTAPLAIVLVLFALSLNFSLGKLNAQFDEISQLDREKTTLTQKLKLLSSISDTLGKGADASMVALPDSNASLLAISQMRAKALENGITVTSLKSGSEVKDATGLSRVDVTFEVEGPKPQILAFLNSIPTVAPITVVDKVKISEIDTATRADVTIKSFWAPLPKTIPSVTQPITDLTEAEYKVLNTISLLNPPSFGTSTEGASSGVAKTDPFTQ